MTEDTKSAEVELELPEVKLGIIAAESTDGKFLVNIIGEDKDDPSSAHLLGLLTLALNAIQRGLDQSPTHQKLDQIGTLINSLVVTNGMLLKKLEMRR